MTLSERPGARRVHSTSEDPCARTHARTHSRTKKQAPQGSGLLCHCKLPPACRRHLHVATACSSSNLTIACACVLARKRARVRACVRACSCPSVFAGYKWKAHRAHPVNEGRRQPCSSSSGGELTWQGSQVGVKSSGSEVKWRQNQATAEP